MYLLLFTVHIQSNNRINSWDCPLCCSMFVCVWFLLFCIDSQLKLRFVWHLCARLFFSSICLSIGKWCVCVCVSSPPILSSSLSQCSHSSNRSTFLLLPVCNFCKIVVVVTWSRRSLWKWAFCTQYLTISHIKESRTHEKKGKSTTAASTDRKVSAQKSRTNRWSQCIHETKFMAI